MPLNDAQVLTVALATWFGGSLSLVGSSILIYITIMQNKSDGYHRFLLGLSIADLFHTVGWMLGPLAVPRETTDRFIALGNHQSCSATGFLLQLGASSYLYNAMLSIYFVLVIRHGMASNRLVLLEWIMHGITILFGFGTATLGLFLNVYNEVAVGALCWIAETPLDCSTRDDLDCNEMANVQVVGYLFGLVPMMSVPIVVVCNILIYCKVRSTEQASQRHDRSTHSLFTESSLSAQTAKATRTRKVAQQAFLYVTAFFNCLLWTIVVRNLGAWHVARRENEGTFFVPILLAQLSSPSQGFFNLLVYVRPRYLSIRERYNYESRLGALYMSLLGAPGHRQRPNKTSVAASFNDEGEIGGHRSARRRSITSIVLLEESYDDLEALRPPTTRQCKEARFAEIPFIHAI